MAFSQHEIQCRVGILWIVWILLSDTGFGEVVSRVDPLALLSATLKTYQRVGCDSEQVSLSCPRGTSISIDIAQYRKTDGTEIIQCPISSIDNILLNSGTDIQIQTPESCMWPNALQYSLLQTVVETCQKKRICKFITSPRGGGDPCPGIRKVVEIAYKCRPYEFRSKMACENDVIQLICNPYSRVAIYSASFGRTEYESLQCAQPHGVREETCLASFTTETVMRKCHGKRRCVLLADISMFGNPCRPETRMYLKVVYTCVPRKVLKSNNNSTIETDEAQQTDLDHDQDELYDDDQFYKESEAVPPAPKLQSDINKISNPSETTFMIESSSVLPPLKSRGIDLDENHRHFYIYLIISIASTLSFCLIIVIGRFLIQRRRGQQNTDSSFPKCEMNERNFPKEFPDERSKIDSVIDLTSTLPVQIVSTGKDESYAIAEGSYKNLGFVKNNHPHTMIIYPIHDSDAMTPTMELSIGTLQHYVGVRDDSAVRRQTGVVGSSTILPNNGSIVDYSFSTIGRQAEYTNVTTTASNTFCIEPDKSSQYYYG